MRKFSRKTLVAGGLVATMALGGIAFAFFSATGSGSGTASVGTSHALDITQVGSVSGLVPNGPAQTINYKVTNNTAGAEQVNQVTTTVASVTSLAIVGDEACDASMFTIVDGLAINQNLQPAGTATGTATIKLVDDGNNQDNCQNAVVTLAFASN
jgi:hypothetical protein